MGRPGARAALAAILFASGPSAKGDGPTFSNPVVESGADPSVIHRDGSYYLCQSRAGSVWVRRSARLLDLGRAEPQRVWTPPKGRPYSRNLWAPELHFLKGKWWIYVAADDGANRNHRMYVLERDAEDPLGPFRFRGRIASPDDRWAIDATVLEMPGDRLYLLWSGWEGEENTAQHLYIAPMKDPATIAGPRVRISSPEHDWEKRGTPHVNEAPQVLRNGSKLFVIYSASGSWTDDYCLGQLSWKGGDVLDPRSWEKKGAPVLARTDEIFGPGHCSFVKSRDGREEWIFFHVAKHRGAGWNRRIHMQRFTWNEDGSPDFGRPAPAGAPLMAPSGEEG